MGKYLFNEIAKRNKERELKMNKRENEMWEKWGKQKLDTFCYFRDLLNWVNYDNEADYFKDFEGNEVKLFKNARVLHWSYKLKGKDKFRGYRKVEILNIKSEFFKLGITTYIIDYDDDDTGEKYRVIPKKYDVYDVQDDKE